MAHGRKVARGVAPELLAVRLMNRNDIETGKDEGDLPTAVSRDDEDVIEIDESELMTVDDDERAADAGDLDYEPDYDRDF